MLTRFHPVWYRKACRSSSRVRTPDKICLFCYSYALWGYLESGHLSGLRFEGGTLVSMSGSLKSLDVFEFLTRLGHSSDANDCSARPRRLCFCVQDESRSYARLGGLPTSTLGCPVLTFHSPGLEFLFPYLYETVSGGPLEQTAHSLRSQA